MKHSKLTIDQQDEAWRLLNQGEDNTDATIAKKIGSTRSIVSCYLADRSKLHMEKVNERINERYKKKDKQRLGFQRKQRIHLHIE